jgi:hypothetical protein
LPRQEGPSNGYPVLIREKGHCTPTKKLHFHEYGHT